MVFTLCPGLRLGGASGGPLGPPALDPRIVEVMLPSRALAPWERAKLFCRRKEVMGVPTWRRYRGNGNIKQS